MSPTHPARHQLLVAGTSTLMLQIALATVAIAANWPAQFGSSGTDAADEFLARGTALSAPLIPIAVLAASLWLLAFGGTVIARIGAAGIGLVAVAILVGGLGEATARATPDVPKAVLLASGAIALALAAVLLTLVVRMFAQMRTYGAVAAT